MADSPTPESQPGNMPTPTEAANGRARHGRNTRTQQLREAGELRELAYTAATKMRETISANGGKFERDDAIALGALLRGWVSIGQSIRVLQGRPLPGSKRPPNDEPKARKRQPANRPPPLPAIPPQPPLVA